MALALPNNFRDLFTEEKLPNLIALMVSRAESYPSMIPFVANVGTFGNTDIAQTTGMSGVGDFAETQPGEDAKESIFRQGFDNTIYAKKYTNSFRVAKEFLDDSKINLLQYGLESFTKGVYEIKEKKVAQIYLEAFTTTGYDGVSLCSSSHPLENGDGLTWSNAGVGADLDLTSFRDLRDIMQDTPNEDGQLLHYMPKYFVCGQAHQDTAFEILKSMYNPENANNAVNSVYDHCQLLPGGYWPYLGNSNAFFMITEPSKHGIQFLMRQELLIEPEYTKKNQTWEYTASLRFGQGVGQARGIVGNPGV